MLTQQRTNALSDSHWQYRGNVQRCIRVQASSQLSNHAGRQVHGSSFLVTTAAAPWKGQLYQLQGPTHFCTPRRNGRRRPYIPPLLYYYEGGAEPPETYLDQDSKMQDNVADLQKRAQQYKDHLLQQALQPRPASTSNLQASLETHGQSGSSQSLKRKLENAIAVMQQGLVERESEVRLLLLAAMSGEHILLIGPPGTAKSEVGRRLTKLISGTYFERLLTRFSVPEELFGPLSMRALEEDKYVRQTRGYLPEAEVAFLDEVFKANSAILNTLLTLINERVFDNGAQRIVVPLLTVVAASNELPESEELDALYDRFLLRKQVQQVSAAGLAELLTYYSQQCPNLDTLEADMQLTRADIKRCKQEALRSVQVPQHVIQMVSDLRAYLQEKIEPPEYVSDRRLVKAVQLLQVAALCNGRDAVSEYDVLLLQHALWQQPGQAAKIADWLLAQLSVEDGTRQVRYLLSGLFGRCCRLMGSPENISGLRAEAAGLRDILLERYRNVASTLEGGFPAVLDNLWLSEGEALALATALQPKLEKTQAAVEELLASVTMLEVALQSGCSPVTLASLMPLYWADFIRNGDMSDIRSIGTTPLKTPVKMKMNP